MPSTGTPSPRSHHASSNKKRRRADDETSGSPQNCQRVSGQSSRNQCIQQNCVGDHTQDLRRDQLPSPTSTRSGRTPTGPPSSYSRKRKAKSLNDLPSPKRARPHSESVHTPTTPIDQWLSNLPRGPQFEPFENLTSFEDMNRPPSKRSRSTDSIGDGSQSRDGSETVVSRDKKYSVYKDVNYPVVLETKGSFMRPSKAGMVAEDQELCERLLTSNQPLLPDDLFNDTHFYAFHSNLRGRSEARICTDLHPRIMPSVENLAICGNEGLEAFIEGYNDLWVKSIPFYGPRPQPDHTFGYKWSNFTEQQRRKLNIEPTQKSLYTAREDIYFPFLTGEVKCGKQGLDLADRPNTHSMTIALRAFVNIYRRANRLTEVHRRVLAFSISHDDNGVRIYAHYPEIDGDNTTYWRETLREFSFGNDKGKERWTCYRFTLNVCRIFALPLLDRLKTLIDDLPDPDTQSFELSTPFEEVSVQSSQDDGNVLESQDEGSKKPRSGLGLDAGLRSMIQSLQQQLEQQQRQSREQLAEQQRQSKEQMALLERQWEQQRKELKEREVSLSAELEEQRKEHKELMKMLKQQGDQITKQNEHIARLLQDK